MLRLRLQDSKETETEFVGSQIRRLIYLLFERGSWQILR